MATINLTHHPLQPSLLESTSTASASGEMTAVASMFPQLEMLQSLWRDAKRSDLTLKATDGAMIPVHRCILAVSSKVFDTMLYGEFEEATKPVVNLHYSGDVVRAIAEYIYTNHVTLLQQPILNPEQAWTLKSLMEAANFFFLPELSLKIELKAVEAMKENPKLAGVFLSACPDAETGSSLMSGIEEMAVSIIQSNPECLLQGDDCSVVYLSASRIENLMNDLKLKGGEFLRFRLLQTWERGYASHTFSDTDSTVTAATTPPESPASSCDAASQVGSTVSSCFSAIEIRAAPSSSRRLQAKEMVKLIHLERIKPSDLAMTVEKSGLVSTRQLLDTYKKQALHMEKDRHDTSWFTLPRPGAWETSGDTLFAPSSLGIHSAHRVERLRCSPLKSGVHRWSLRVWIPDDGCSSDDLSNLGVASSSLGGSLLFLGATRKGWGYCQNGDAWHDNGKHRGFPRFRDGSTVAFTLDLQGEGTLSASVDDGETFLLFKDMHAQLQKTRGKGEKALGFIPAVNIDPNGSVRFLGFQ